MGQMTSRGSDYPGWLGRQMGELGSGIESLGDGFLQNERPIHPKMKIVIVYSLSKCSVLGEPFL